MFLWVCIFKIYDWKILAKIVNVPWNNLFWIKFEAKHATLLAKTPSCNLLLSFEISSSSYFNISATCLVFREFLSIINFLSCSTLDNISPVLYKPYFRFSLQCRQCFFLLIYFQIDSLHDFGSWEYGWVSWISSLLVGGSKEKAVRSF